MIEYDFKKHGELQDLLKGISVLVIGDPSGCTSCVIAKSKLEIISHNWRNINFIFFDNSKDNIEKYIPGISVLAYPYVRGYRDDKLIIDAYSAEVYIIGNIIDKLLNEDYEGKKTR